MTARSALLAAFILECGLFAQPELFIPTFSTAIDSAGNAYSIGFSVTPTPAAAQPNPGNGTCLHAEFPIGNVPVACYYSEITKRDAAGNIIFATLLGGASDDVTNSIAIDAAGNSYVTGTTGGKLPVTENAALTSIPSNGTFAAKLSPDGSKFIYVTYLPVTVKSVTAIVADARGNAYVTGRGQDGHAFAIKISADGSAFVYTRPLSIGRSEQGTAIDVDVNGNVAVAGWTSQDETFRQNVFVARIDTSGIPGANTVLAGSVQDVPNVVKIDGDGNLYIAGMATSLDFPTTPGSFSSAADIPLWTNVPGGFAAKLAPDLAIVYSTYIPAVPGGLYNGVTQAALGNSGDVYLSGATQAGFPTTPSAPQGCFAIELSVNSFILHLDAQGRVIDATYGTGQRPLGLGVLSSGLIALDQQTNLTSLGAPVLSRIRFGEGSSACLSKGVLNSATFLGSGVSPGEFVTLTGLGIGPDSGIGATPDSQGRPPISLAGVQVLFDGQPAPILYAQSRQINVLAPFELAGNSSTSITVQFNGASFGPFTSQVVPHVQGIFRRQPNLSADAVATNEDGTTNDHSNPAAIGSIVSLWGTGFGITPGCMTGVFNTSGAVSLTSAPPQITASSSPPLIEYIGSAPTFLCGVEQINLRIPLDALAGAYSITASGVPSVIYVK